MCDVGLYFRPSRRPRKALKHRGRQFVTVSPSLIHTVTCSVFCGMNLRMSQVYDLAFFSIVFYCTLSHIIRWNICRLGSYILISSGPGASDLSSARGKTKSVFTYSFITSGYHVSLLFVDTALAGLVTSLVVATSAQTPPGFHYDANIPLRLAHGDGWRFRTGAQYRAQGW